MLYCKSCGTPYAGGCICEKCGTRFSDEDIMAEQNCSLHSEKKGLSSGAKIAVIAVSVIIGLNILAVLAAIFVPAFIGYRARVREYENNQTIQLYSVTEAYSSDF